MPSRPRYKGVDQPDRKFFTAVLAESEHKHLSLRFHALAVRTESASLFRVGLISNLPMLGAVILTILLQLAVIYVPALNAVFNTQPLPLFDLAVCLLLSTLVLFAVEAEK